ASQPVFFGAQFPGGRAPAAFVEAQTRDLVRYLRADPSGPFVGSADYWHTACLQRSPALRGPQGAAELPRWQTWGFAADNAEPILKADWQAVPELPDPSDVFTPRSNSFAPLRRAPPRVRAFMSAFRDVNAACWDRIARALEGLKVKGEELDRQEGWSEVRGLGRVATVFANALARRSHFGVVEAQVWSGGCLSMRSHMDGATSMLHLGLTL
ncbi:unnamed protein product, partial [Polarella glacialis]